MNKLLTHITVFFFISVPNICAEIDPQYPERDKVPTMAAFEGNNLAAWGVGVKSLSPEEIPNYGSYKQFKPLFDSDNTTVAAEAERCTRVFLKELRLYLEQALPHEKQLEGFTWDNSRIKYVFSYPTTWDLDTQMRFSYLVREAGYLPLDNQDIMTSLDEAQASIIHFLCGRHGSGEFLPKPEILAAEPRTSEYSRWSASKAASLTSTAK